MEEKNFQLYGPDHNTTQVSRTSQLRDSVFYSGSISHARVCYKSLFRLNLTYPSSSAAESSDLLQFCSDARLQLRSWRTSGRSISYSRSSSSDMAAKIRPSTPRRYQLSSSFWGTLSIFITTISCSFVYPLTSKSNGTADNNTVRNFKLSSARTKTPFIVFFSVRELVEGKFLEHCEWPSRLRSTTIRSLTYWVKYTRWVNFKSKKKLFSSYSLLSFKANSLYPRRPDCSQFFYFLTKKTLQSIHSTLTVKSWPTSIIFAPSQPKQIWKIRHAFTYLLF